jgi:hypothetical protein
MKTETLPAGVRRRVHVYAPNVKDRISGYGEKPTIAIREETDGYNTMRLVRKATFLGRVSLEERFDQELPTPSGTGSVVYNVTDGAIVVEDDDRPTVVDMRRTAPEFRGC